MTTTTDHYLGIDLHKRQAQVAVLDDKEKLSKRSALATRTLMRSHRSTPEVALRWKQGATTSRSTTD